MTINKKISGGYLILLIMLVTVSILGIVGLTTLESRYGHFLDVHERIVDVSNELKYEAVNEPRFFRAALLYEDQADAYRDALQETYDTFDELISEAKDLAVTKEGLALLDTIVALEIEHRNTYQVILGMVAQGNKEEAIAAAGDLTGDTTEIIVKVEQFQQREKEMEVEERADVIALQNALIITIITVSIAAFITGILIAAFLGRNITRQLRAIITQLSSSSAELSAASSQLASGAAETASAVSQTTATVEEVKQTAGLATEKAKNVSESTQKATQTAQGGQKAVDESIEAMKRIQEQMESIAENIISLSEQSTMIGEITATVIDIAEQSNLLAVNASIEAAKAGEQGKGFAVVAREVKSMADQSKQATSQVRTILSDIQKGINTAVMLTEQGSKASEAGVKQSAEAGQAIQTLVASIAEAGQAATQIVASNQQQLVGVEQVATAMESIKQASTDSASSTKQTESTARNLHELSENLMRMIDRPKEG